MPGVIRISDAAMQARLRRVMQPNCRGEVPAEREEQGPPRADLSSMRLQQGPSCVYFTKGCLGRGLAATAFFVPLAQDAFVEELQLLKEEEWSNEMRIEGEFASEKQMSEEWGWSKCLESKRSFDTTVC